MLSGWLGAGKPPCCRATACLRRIESVCGTLQGPNVRIRTIFLHPLDSTHCICGGRLGYYRFRHVGSVVLLRDFTRSEDLEYDRRKKSPADIDSSRATLVCFRLPRAQRQAMVKGSDQIRLCHAVFGSQCGFCSSHNKPPRSFLTS
jgi:hypothetical protein